jgi:hypothetical protein
MRMHSRLRPRFSRLRTGHRAHLAVMRRPLGRHAPKAVHKELRYKHFHRILRCRRLQHSRICDRQSESIPNDRARYHRCLFASRSGDRDPSHDDDRTAADIKGERPIAPVIVNEPSVARPIVAVNGIDAGIRIGEPVCDRGNRCGIIARQGNGAANSSNVIARIIRLNCFRRNQRLRCFKDFDCSSISVEVDPAALAGEVPEGPFATTQVQEHERLRVFLKNSGGWNRQNRSFQAVSDARRQEHRT